MNATATILLVEDNEDDAELCLRAFRKSRVVNEIVVARDGVEALQLLGLREPPLDGRPIRPYIVLLDLKLPKIGGLEVLKAIRADERTRLTPVIILTSSREERDLVEAYATGVNSYIVKPVDFAQFEGAIRQLELYWLVLNHPPPGGRA